jgi:hypothetical protein
MVAAGAECSECTQGSGSKGGRTRGLGIKNRYLLRERRGGQPTLECGCILSLCMSNAMGPTILEPTA